MQIYYTLFVIKVHGECVTTDHMTKVKMVNEERTLNVILAWCAEAGASSLALVGIRGELIPTTSTYCPSLLLHVFVLHRIAHLAFISLTKSFRSNVRRAVEQLVLVRALNAAAPVSSESDSDPLLVLS